MLIELTKNDNCHLSKYEDQHTELRFILYFTKQ